MSTRTPKYVPKQSIAWLMGQIHVGTSDEVVAADISRRYIQGMRNSCFERNDSTERRIKACITYALKCHHDNGALYTRVMRGDL